MRTLLVLCLATLALPAADWPRFRGPNGSGVADAKNLPDTFGPDNNLVWKTAMLPGYSSPIVAGDRIFLTAHEKDQLYTIALDRASGAEVWKRPAPKGMKPRLPNSPVSPSPASDGSNVYVFFESFGLVSYDRDGKERWQMPLGPFTAAPYGMGSSPILHDRRLYMLCDLDTGSYLLAADKDTGKFIWKKDRPEVTHGFSTPIVYQPRQGPTQLIISGSYQVVGYSADTGEKIWWVGGLAWQAKSLPVIHGDTLFLHSFMASVSELGQPSTIEPFEKVLAAHDKDKDGKLAKDEAPNKEMQQLFFLFDLDKDGFVDKSEWDVQFARNQFKSGLFAIRLGGKGDVTNTHVLWTYEKSLPNIPSPLYYDGAVYLLREGGILTSFNPKTGEVLKQGRVQGALEPFFASPVAADGKIYLLTKSCKVAVLKTAPEWQVLSVNDLADDCWATPAIDGNRIYVRTQSAVYAFGAKS
jgi:outer membrane protein assembly factor BamB